MTVLGLSLVAGTPQPTAKAVERETILLSRNQRASPSLYCIGSNPSRYTSGSFSTDLLGIWIERLFINVNSSSFPPTPPKYGLPLRGDPEAAAATEAGQGHTANAMPPGPCHMDESSGFPEILMDLGVL